MPDDVDELREMAEGLRLRVRRLQLECDVLEATRDILGKDPGTDPKRLTNQEKASLVRTLRPRWRLKDLLEAVGMARSSYEYAVGAAGGDEPERARIVREVVVTAFDRSGGTYGYRRVQKELGSAWDMRVGQWTVRRVMREEGLLARRPRRKRRYSSYVGEVSETPANTCLQKDGTHVFSASSPNELWVTDITEFAIPAGEVNLSPVINCFDGMPVSWSVSTSPDAEMANSSLGGACAQLMDEGHSRVHSDRGGHCRWSGWLSICEKHELVRSMSHKGCSLDNSRAEGFFGRLKVEFFYGRDWQGVTVDEFIGVLDAYMRWYRDVRVKSDLG